MTGAHRAARPGRTSPPRGLASFHGIFSGLLLALAATCGWAEGGTARPAVLTGSWYPADPEELTAYLDTLLDEASPATAGNRAVRALIVPHAAYPYSGSTAAGAYRLIRGQAFDRVIVLAPAHHDGFRGFSLLDVTHYETPLGTVLLDIGSAERLREHPLAGNHPGAHAREHAVEIQLPFLQKSLRPG